MDKILIGLVFTRKEDNVMTVLSMNDTAVWSYEVKKHLYDDVYECELMSTNKFMYMGGKMVEFTESQILEYANKS